MEISTHNRDLNHMWVNPHMFGINHTCLLFSKYVVHGVLLRAYLQILLCQMLAIHITLQTVRSQIQLDFILYDKNCVLYQVCGYSHTVKTQNKL